MSRKMNCVFFMLLLFSAFTLIHGDVESKYLNHHLVIDIDPVNHFIHVKDSIRFPGYLSNKLEEEKLHFLLHGNLKIKSLPDHVILKKESGQLKSDFFGINTAEFQIDKKIPIAHYSIKINKKKRPHKNLTSKDFIITLVYEGQINHPIQQSGAEYARGFSETPGIICEKGVYLAGSTFWVPWFNNELVTFTLEAETPNDWYTISQGKYITSNTSQSESKEQHLKKNDSGKSKSYSQWHSPEPMDEIYLTAAKFEKYTKKIGNVTVMAFLRSKDPGLASKYLETTGQYLEMYQALIGPYPYSKFALIENFWETGYGMPSFTLLGPKVIRFPFILHSSYPHELLHNWWGNSVYVDYEKGNWCEGLTVYLADHLIKQQRNKGMEYRKTTLQNYTHYASGKKDEFPLTQFKARYDALSSSIGYGKSMMMFHMLRQIVGDNTFIKAIRHFYKENKFKRAVFDDIRSSFEHVTGKDLKPFFDQWVTGTGVPELKVSTPNIKITRATEKQNATESNQYELSFMLKQIQQGKPYSLVVSTAIYLEGSKEAVIKLLDLNEKQQSFKFTFSQKPLGIDVDPRFDLARKLHTNEIPPTLSNAFGAGNVLILLPSGSSQSFLDGYKTLAEGWAKESGNKILIKMDIEISVLPNDKAVWLLGWENIHNNIIETGTADYGMQFHKNAVTIEKKQLSISNHSIISAAKNPNNPSQVVIMLSTDRIAALPGLGRKLPHYGKYSYLAFEGDEPTNMLKGQWPAVNSPMSVRFPTDSGANGETAKISQTLPTEKPLARLAPLFSSDRIMEHIRYLSSKELEGRGFGSKGLEKAGEYIADAFKKSGLKPAGDENSYFQVWKAEAGKTNSTKKKAILRNVIGVIPGTDPALKDQAVVICAHYDHLGRGWPDVHKGDKGKIHPGADDNASGVSVLLELAHVLGKNLKPARSVIFAAFTAEESGLLGSKYFVHQCKKDNRIITAAVNMDTVGRLKDGEKVMVIGGSSAREWKFIFMGIGYTVGVESLLVKEDLHASDQVSFIQAGIPAIQLFSGPHSDYHRPTDTFDKIESAGLIRIATMAKEAMVYLSERKEPLTFISGKNTGEKSVNPSGKPSGKVGNVHKKQGKRRVRTGIMPDFSFSGKGMRVGMVSTDSPAEKAGLKKGDTIIKLGDTEVMDLRGYSNALGNYTPGDTVMFHYMRDGKEFTTKVMVEAR